MNQVIQQLKDRKSVRVFTDQPITPDKVSAILEAAVNAPTAGNQQFYTIIHVTDPKRRSWRKVATTSPLSQRHPLCSYSARIAASGTTRSWNMAARPENWELAT